MGKDISLFLDSGAFSAFTQGAVIDIHEYISFIKKYARFIDVYANLDVIGDPVATKKNQEIMEKAGLKPLPCFHYGEEVKYLREYIKSNEYIALGGMASSKSGAVLSNDQRQQWLDEIFSKYICDSEGLPKVKVHGFGLTSLKLMLRYPWYSVDSTSWVVTARLGSVYVPRRRNGKWIYGEDSWKVLVSSRSPSKGEKGKHFNSYTPMEKSVILDYFKEKGFVLGQSKFKMVKSDYALKENEKWFGGKNEQGDREVEIIIESGLCNEYVQRDELNAMYFVDLEKSIPEWPWPFKLERKGSGFGL